MSPQRAVHEHFSDLRRLVFILSGVIVLVVLAVGWVSEKRSCDRSVPIREAIIETREINRDAIPWWEKRDPVIAERLRQRVEADEGVQPLDCFKLVPEA